MRRCTIGCEGMFHSACVVGAERAASIGPGGKWRCPMCTSVATFMGGGTGGPMRAVPDEMGPLVLPEGDPPGENENSNRKKLKIK
eukprot:1184339-Prorocentrum_minimum.AAC.1